MNSQSGEKTFHEVRAETGVSATQKIQCFVDWYMTLPAAYIDDLDEHARRNLATFFGVHLARLKEMQTKALDPKADASPATSATAQWCAFATVNFKNAIHATGDFDQEHRNGAIKTLDAFVSWLRELPFGVIAGVDSAVRLEFIRFLYGQFERVKATRETIKGAEQCRTHNRKRNIPARTVLVYSSFVRRLLLREFSYMQLRMRLRDKERNGAWLAELSARIREIPERFDIHIEDERIEVTGYSIIKLDVTSRLLEEPVEQLLELDKLIACLPPDRSLQPLFEQITASVWEPLHWLRNLSDEVAKSVHPVLTSSPFIEPRGESVGSAE